MQQPQACAPNRKVSIRRRQGGSNSKKSRNERISFVLLQLEYRVRPAIRVPQARCRQICARKPEIKKVHLISSPLQVPNQIQVPAPGHCRLKSKIRMWFGRASISPSISLGAVIAALSGACSESRSAINIGIYKIRTVRIVCQELPRKRCLARSIRPSNDVDVPAHQFLLYVAKWLTPLSSSTN